MRNICPKQKVEDPPGNWGSRKCFVVFKQHIENIVSVKEGENGQDEQIRSKDQVLLKYNESGVYNQSYLCGQG